MFAYPGEGIVSGVAGFFGGIAGDVKDFVLSAIRALADLVWAAIDAVSSTLSAVQNAVLDAYTAAINFAQSLVNELGSTVNALYWSAVSYARDAVNAAVSGLTSLVWSAVSTVRDALMAVLSAVRDELVSLVSMVRDGIMAVISDVRDVIEAGISAVRWALETLIDNLRAFVNVALSALHDLFFDALHALEWVLRALVDTARAALVEAIHDAQTATNTIVNTVRDELQSGLNAVNDYVFGPVQAIIGAIEAVIDWLIALATFPFSTARDIWRSFRQTGGKRILDTSAERAGRLGSHVLDHAKTYVTTDQFDYQLPALPSSPGAGGGGGGGVVGPGVGTPDRIAFATALLAALGAPNTSSNMAFLVAWMTHEGTSASFNPLATTLDYGSNTIFNRVGVRNYADFATGVEATRRTLLSSYYVRIVADLRNGDGHAAGQEHQELSTWSGGGYDTIAV